MGVTTMQRMVVTPMNFGIFCLWPNQGILRPQQGKPPVNKPNGKRPPTADASDNILEVKNLKTYFYTEDGVVKAVDGVDFTVRRGEVLGIVGESGCGKSVTSLSIMPLA